MRFNSRTIVTSLFIIGLAVNAVWMLLNPEGWFHATPGVSQTGPLNEHFVQDIGIAYLVVCVSFVLALRHAKHAFILLLPGVVFMFGHAALHLLEGLSENKPFNSNISDWLLVIIPGLFCCFLLLTAKRADIHSGG